MYTDQLCARWLFLEEKATQRLWFRGIAVGEPLYRLGWRRLGLRGAREKRRGLCFRGTMKIELSLKI
jgi:hypothetical protein